HHGQHQIKQHEIERLASEQPDRLLAIGRADRRVSVGLNRLDQRVANRRIVFDDEHFSLMGNHGDETAGRRISNTAPFSDASKTRSPPARRNTPRAMLNPSPTPGDLSVSVRPPCTNGSNARWPSSRGTPGPPSATRSRISAGVRVSARRITPLSG